MRTWKNSKQRAEEFFLQRMHREAFVVIAEAAFYESPAAEGGKHEYFRAQE